MSDSADAGPGVTVTMLADGQCRIDYGDQSGGRWVVVPYVDVKDYVLSLKPRLELIELYGLAD
jgi:hypothetical protein